MKSAIFILVTCIALGIVFQSNPECVVLKLYEGSGGFTVLLDHSKAMKLHVNSQGVHEIKLWRVEGGASTFMIHQKTTLPWGKYTALEIVRDTEVIEVHQEQCYSTRLVDKEILNLVITASSVWLIVSMIFFNRQSPSTIAAMVISLVVVLLQNPKSIESLAEKILKKLLY